MPAPTISPLPTPPSRSTDPANFAVEADAFVAALPEFQTDANAQATYLDALATTVDGDATAAAASAAAALVSENAAADSETNAAASEAAAAISESNAAASELAAAASETAADISATNAASSAAEAEAIVAGIGFQDIIFVNAAMSPYSVTSATNGTLIACDTSAGNIIVNLPQISGLTLPFTIGAKKTTTDANTLTINRAGSDTFDDGSTSKVLASVSGYTLLPDTDTAPDVWVAIGFGGANAGPITGSGLTANSGKLLGRTSAGVGSIEEINAPTGAIVGTSDSQTLSNKTLEVPNITNGMTLTGAAGSLGQVLMSQGSGVAPIWGSAGGANVQTFTSSGTWTKPNNANFVLVEVWGAGGGGGRPTAGASNPAGSGGGGGAYNYRLFSASEFSNTVPVTIGAGGSGGFANGAGGSNGGATNFGQLLYAYGGGVGAGNNTGSNAQLGGGGGGVLGGGTNADGGAPVIVDTFNNAIFLPQNMGGGRGGGRTTNASSAIRDEPTGSASAFGGGGGAGSYNNTSFSNNGGGSSAYGGGGGGSGGYSTTGGFSQNITPTQGGGPVPISRNLATYGAAGGGGISQQGLTTQYAIEPFQGGGGGAPAISLTTYASGTLFCANNGAQTVLFGVGSGNGFAFPWGLLFVSSDGLANYTVYSTGRSANNTGIVHDGTKYVLATLQQSTRKYLSSIYSTTDFVTFTDHPVPSDFRTQELRTTNDNGFKYINGLYFLCMSTDLYYSSDLVTWTRANVAGGTNAIINSVAYDGTKYYALQSNGTVYVSTNLTSWASYASGVGTNAQCIAASPSVVVATGTTQSKYSIDGGVNWVNLPTISANQGRIVRYISSTATWLITTAVSLDIYYSSDPTVSWTLATDSASATGYRDIAYNGTQYIATGGYGGTANVVSTTSNLASAFTLQAASSFTAPALKGCNGGIAGGGGGGAASSTTTSNGGDGGNGYCRVYTW